MTLDHHFPALVTRARALLGLPGGPPAKLAAAEIRPAARAVLELHEGLVADRALARPDTYAGRNLGAYLLWWWPQTYLKVQATLGMVSLPRRPQQQAARQLPGAGPASCAGAVCRSSRSWRARP